MIDHKFDSSDSAFFAKQLEYLKQRSYDKLFADLKASELLPFSMEANPGAKSITYYQYERLGRAEIIGDYANDLPRADIRGQEFTTPIREYGASYGYSFKDIRASSMSGMPGLSLEARRADAARMAIEEKLNKIAWLGDRDNGVSGLLDNENITRVAAPLNSGATSRQWEDKTNAEILEDMTSIVSDMVNDTFGIEIPDTMLLPIEQFNYINDQPLQTGSDTTILTHFLANNRYIKKVDWLNEARNAGLGVGAVPAGTDVMIVYKQDANKMTFEVPQPFEQFDPRHVSMGYIIDCQAATAGLLIYYPKSVSVMEGI